MEEVGGPRIVDGDAEPVLLRNRGADQVANRGLVGESAAWKANPWNGSAMAAY